MLFQCFASQFFAVFLDGNPFFQASLGIGFITKSLRNVMFQENTLTGSFIKMTKSELIQKLAERNPHLFLRDIEKIVDTVFDEISEALVDGDRVELRGFGAFSIKHRDARVGRNPRTGETVQVDAKRLPFFKTGKALRERLNDDNETPTKESNADKKDDGFYRPFSD